MRHTTESVEQRVATLERSYRRAKLVASLSPLAVLLVLGAASTRGQPQAPDGVRTYRLVVVDAQGQTRAVLGQDPTNTQRVSRAAGLTLYDDKGSERGGFSTMADGSVVIGNKTRAVARLLSEEGPGGVRGIQVFKWEPDGSRHHIRTISFDGDARDSVSP